MIDSRKTYEKYVQMDLMAHQIKRLSLYTYLRCDCLRYQLRLRKIEYLYNVHRGNPLCQLWRYILEFINHHLAIKLGLTILKNFIDNVINIERDELLEFLESYKPWFVE